jgi:hypothetical protein
MLFLTIQAQPVAKHFPPSMTAGWVLSNIFFDFQVGTAYMLVDIINYNYN